MVYLNIRLIPKNQHLRKILVRFQFLFSNAKVFFLFKKLGKVIRTVSYFKVVGHVFEGQLSDRIVKLFCIQKPLSVSLIPSRRMCVCFAFQKVLNRSLLELLISTRWCSQAFQTSYITNGSFICC